jgi:hypothetical protein
VRIQQKSSGKTIGFAPRNVLNLDGLMSCHGWQFVKIDDIIVPRGDHFLLFFPAIRPSLLPVALITFFFFLNLGLYNEIFLPLGL